MSQSANQKPKKTYTGLNIAAFVCALLSPLVVFYGLLTGLMGLAYDVPHAQPTPWQSVLGNVFYVIYIVFLLLGPISSVLAIVLASIGLSGKKNYNKWVFILVGALLVFTIALWLIGTWSIPPEL